MRDTHNPAPCMKWASERRTFETLDEISERACIAKSTLREWLKEFGIKPLSRQRWPLGTSDLIAAKRREYLHGESI